MNPTQSERNDDPAHIAAVAAMAEKRGCDWPGRPCGRDIPEFNGRDAMCLCESLVVNGSTGELCDGCKHFTDDCICDFEWDDEADDQVSEWCSFCGVPAGEPCNCDAEQP